MVADLGGGTVDITVQRQKVDGTLVDVVPVAGGPEGGTSVDRAFHTFLETVLGKHVIEAFKNSCVEDYLIFTREFEFKKRSSGHPQTKKIRIRIPLQFEKVVEKTCGIKISKALERSEHKELVTYNDKTKKMNFEPSKFRDFFKEAIDGTIKHIDGVLSKKECFDLKDIIIVGGFSESEVLKNALKEAFGSYNIRIPSEPGLAVLAGAVYHGHLLSKFKKHIRSKCKRLVVVGIDLGTISSGYAFSWKSHWKEVINVNKTNDRICTTKTTSALLLCPDESFIAFGYEAESILMDLSEESLPDLDSGSDSDSQEEAAHVKKNTFREYYYFSGCDMFLLKENKLHRESEIKDFSGKPMRVLDVFSVSIKCIKNSFLERINKSITGAIFAEDIDFVLTVPAIWGDIGKMLMREAAVQAGIKEDQLTLVLEPEAASIYCQNYFSRYDEEQQFSLSDEFRTLVENKEKYMVLDLGDMFDVAVDKQNEMGIIEGIIQSTGGPFGGTSLKRPFEAFLISIFDREIVDIFKNSYFEDFLMLLDEFETKKRSNMHANVRITIPLSLERLFKKKNGISLSNALEKSQYNGLVTFKCKKLIFEPSLFNSFFQPAIDGIIKSIQNVLANQLCADLTHIIMVGGLSGSKIIQKVLQETFPKCRFLIPDEPELAVLAGAVYFGHLPKAVSGRFARFTYGIKICRRFIPGEDPESKRIIVDKVARCQDVFFSIVQRGDQIQTAKEYSCLTMMLKQNQHIATIYVSDNKTPKYIDDEGCKAMGSLTIKVLNESKKNAEIEQTIIFGETDLTFRVSQCGSGRCSEISFDLLDEANIPDFLHT